MHIQEYVNLYPLIIVAHFPNRFDSRHQTESRRGIEPSICQKIGLIICNLKAGNVLLLYERSIQVKHNL